MVFGVAVAAAVLVTVWWGIVGLSTENFGSDCLSSFGETGRRADHCYRVNDRAETWLPRLVSASWISAALMLVLPRRLHQGRRTAVGIAVACLVVAVVLGSQAVIASAP
ncbi:hypothetical protein GCM10012286_33540 [Streptomyces lasiicapitis]|uniref:DUF998 domain-containing protein n=1 Tax=Streptomyces lasiicapitis TaxID=1923961 RepID=A0ABQ2M0X6_9ACTN|nr:hypothetical protein GCM10012286_33540 [Streptomyces lasiicapitis]